MYKQRISDFYNNRLLAWTLLVAWMCLIFAFSNQAHSGQITEEYLGGMNVPLRKMAHMFEYFMLFLLSQNAFRLSFFRGRVITAACALVFSMLYAMTDEWHQMYVPGRSATAMDVLVDTTGALIALIGTRYLLVLRSFWSRTRN